MGTTHKYKHSKHGQKRLKNKHKTQEVMVCSSAQQIHDSPQCVDMTERLASSVTAWS